MTAPSWADGPRPLPTDTDRAARHTVLSFDEPTIPIQRTDTDRLAETRAALRAARDSLVATYRGSTSGHMTRERLHDELHIALERIAAAQTALDGEPPRRRFNPRPGRRPIWANCGGPRR